MENYLNLTFLKVFYIFIYYTYYFKNIILLINYIKLKQQINNVDKSKTLNECTGSFKDSQRT